MNVSRELKSFWAHPIVLLADGGQEEARFDPFGDSINLVARLVHDLPRMYHVHGNRFGHTEWYSEVMYVEWKLVLVRFEIVLVSA